MNFNARLDRLEGLSGNDLCPECHRTPDGRLPTGATFAPIVIPDPDSPPSPEPLDCPLCGRPPRFGRITLDGDREVSP